MISHTMNKLIKRFLPSPVHAFFSSPPHLKSSLPNQKVRGKEKGREEERKTENYSETENVCVCRSTTTTRKRRGVKPIGEERGSRREREGDREKEPDELLE